MSYRSVLIDQLLEEARKKGLYDPEFRGERALVYDDLTHVDEADRVAFQLLKSNGFAPPFLEERKYLVQERKHLSDATFVLRDQYPRMQPHQRMAALTEIRRALTDLWRRTLDYNLTAPVAFQIEGIRVEYEISRIEQSLTDAANDPAEAVE